MDVLKEYNVIGTSFKGLMVFKYHLNGLLASFELKEGCELDDKQINWLFSRHFPYKETQLSHFRAIENFRITEGEFDLSFEAFWKAYDRKLKRMMSEKAWNKLTTSEKMNAIAGIRHYDGYLARKRNMEKAHPSTYLNQKYWLDNWGSAN